MTVQSALAIVSHPFTTTSEGKKEPNWNLEPVTLPAPGPNEIVVEMIATGICHTDIALSLYPIPDESTPKPAVLGHEGNILVLGFHSGY
jgi:Zn-dependent alcohol dehydrogenase